MNRMVCTGQAMLAAIASPVLGGFSDRRDGPRPRADGTTGAL